MTAQPASSSSELALEELASPRPKRPIMRFARAQPMGVLGIVLIVIIVFGAVFAPVLAPHDPQEFTPDVLKAPSLEHPMGTTREGKDVYSRVLYGGRVSLRVGIAVVVISIIGGTLLALLAGFLGGVLDFTLSRAAELLISFPAILLALTLRTSIGNDVPDLKIVSQGEVLVIISICIIFTPTVFRIMRGSVLEQRSSQYVESARVVGATEWRVMLRHILPNLAGLMIVITSTALPAAILTESGLSFLGVGVPVGTPSWGADLSGSARSFFVTAPWIAIFPGLALSITVLAFNLLGDALRDDLDPRLRGRI
jgi:ABC-type dipeptide/oligopeptide/nickel transport system permease subunit